MYDVTEGVVFGLGFPQFLDGAAGLSASSDMASVANATLLATSALAGSSGMTATVTIGNVSASVMSAQVDMVVVPNVVNAAAALVAGTSNMTATSSNLVFADAALSAQAEMTASETLVRFLVPRVLTGTVSLSASLYEPLNVLALPTTQYTYTEDRLLRRYSITSGKSLLITGTVGVIEDFVAQSDTLDADYYFAGGHRYVLDTAEVAAVTNAGYSDLITIETL